jgi:acyl dehydratase
MTDPATAAQRKGIFDRTTKGRSTMPMSVQIERQQIRFFANVLGEVDPMHTDLAIARARGYPDIVAPPSFFMVMEAMANEELARRGQPSAASLVGCDYRYLLHGDERYEYSGFVYAGDEITLTTNVVDFYDKKGGALEFVTLSSVVSHAQRGVLVKTTRNLLHRLG